MSFPWTAGQNDQIGGVQPTELSVQIDEAGSHADCLTTSFECRLGTEDSVRQRCPESAKSTLCLSHRSEVEQPPFRAFDLVVRRVVEVLAKCIVDDIFA